ncbi:MAG: diguanylate cyclase [Leptolyngbyaceae cyanobacterium]
MANILIVDDDLSTRAFLSLALKQDGHNIVESSSGEDCLSIVQQERLDMVLLDAQMPGMDGFTCCAHMKTVLGDKCPPIIMITGLADKASVDRAFSVGAIDYTTKPVHITVLRHRIHQVLHERDLRKHLAAVNKQLSETNRELQILTRVDGLTRVANRRYFEEVLASEWNRMAEQKRFLSLLICDIDYFKQYNDSYGHLEGDRCLKKISQILERSIIRASDLVARYGGEEFVILLPDTEAVGAHAIAKRIHENILYESLPHRGSKVASVISISIGGTYLIPSPDVQRQDFFKAADKALYLAKARGRNCTVLDNYCSL